MKFKKSFSEVQFHLQTSRIIIFISNFSYRKKLLKEKSLIKIVILLIKIVLQKNY